MPRLPLVVTIVALSMLVAGCADSGTKAQPAPTSSNAAPATVTADTGGIDGSVVDEELMPIAGVDVAILKSNLTAKTDAQGKFSFSQLEPGSYDIVAQKLGYETSSRKADVVAGEITNVKIALSAFAIIESYAEPLIMNGYIVLSNALLGAAEGDAGVPAGCEKCHFKWNASSDVVAMVLEVAYKPTLSVPPSMKLYTQVYPSDRASGSPVVNEEWDSGHKEQLEIKKASPYYQYLGCGLTSFCYDQRFTEYVTLFHGAPPEEDFTALPPSV